MENRGQGSSAIGASDNEYAVGDRAAVEAGALAYLNTITVVLRKVYASSIIRFIDIWLVSSTIK